MTVFLLVFTRMNGRWMTELGGGGRLACCSAWRFLCTRFLKAICWKRWAIDTPLVPNTFSRRPWWPSPNPTRRQGGLGPLRDRSGRPAETPGRSVRWRRCRLWGRREAGGRASSSGGTARPGRGWMDGHGCQGCADGGGWGTPVLCTWSCRYEEREKKNTSCRAHFLNKRVFHPLGGPPEGGIDPSQGSLLEYAWGRDEGLLLSSFRFTLLCFTLRKLL